MKLHTVFKCLRWVYLAFSILGAAFYCLANFGKPLTGQVGVLWLLLIAVAIAAWGIGKERPVFPLVVAGMTVMQVPIIYTWVYLDGGAVFYIFSFKVEVGLYGAIFHGLLLLSGIAIAVHGFMQSSGKMPRSPHE